MLSKIMNYIDLPFLYVPTFVKSSADVCVVWPWPKEIFWLFSIKQQDPTAIYQLVCL